MSHVRRATGIQRILVLATVIAVAFGAGSAFVTYGTSGPQGTTFFGCLTKGGILYNMSVGTAMECKPNDQAINWISYTPTALDAAYVNEGQPASITTGMIANGEVRSDDLGDDSVISGKILDGTITEGDLADNSVNSGEIIDGSVGTDDLATGAVTADKIDPYSVQKRISNSCEEGTAIQWIQDDGWVGCVAPGYAMVLQQSETVEVGPASTKSVEIMCPAHHTVTGGGVRTNGGDMKVRESGWSSGDFDTSGWYAEVRNDHALNTGEMYVQVFCIPG